MFLPGTARLLPSIGKSDRNLVRDAWDLLAQWPGGTRVFSRFIGMAAPYSGTVRAHVVELRVGYAKVVMEDRREVRNHLSSVHAIALANLAELAGNLAVAYSIPDDARFIVAGIDLEYVKKARGRLTGVGRPPAIESNERREIEVPVLLSDASGDPVVRATLRTLVGPKPGSAAPTRP